MTLVFVAGASLHAPGGVRRRRRRRGGDPDRQRATIARTASSRSSSAEDDPSGRGFHTLQLLIALGSGGIDGLGLGASRQKFFYVPGAHTDGIFAIIGEELGFIGCAIVLALFAFLMARGFRVILRARDDFGALLAVGIVSWIGYQALINIGGDHAHDAADGHSAAVRELRRVGAAGDAGGHRHPAQRVALRRRCEGGRRQAERRPTARTRSCDARRSGRRGRMRTRRRTRAPRSQRRERGRERGESGTGGRRHGRTRVSEPLPSPARSGRAARRAASSSSCCTSASRAASTR